MLHARPKAIPMAYFDPHSAFLAPRRAAARPADHTAFSSLEWTVILLAAGDTLRSLRTPSRLSRALGTVLGRGTESSLADPRLEALRRAAVFAWRKASVPAAEVERFLQAGFEPAQLNVLATSIAAATANQDRHQ